MSKKSLSTKSQCEIILRELKRGRQVTTDQFRKLGIYQCSARIYDLRKRGWDIKTEILTGIHDRDGYLRPKMARYSLSTSAEA